jgi:hypothetical protein
VLLRDTLRRGPGADPTAEHHNVLGHDPSGQTENILDIGTILFALLLGG